MRVVDGGVRTLNGSGRGRIGSGSGRVFNGSGRTTASGSLYTASHTLSPRSSGVQSLSVLGGNQQRAFATTQRKDVGEDGDGKDTGKEVAGKDAGKEVGVKDTGKEVDGEDTGKEVDGNHAMDATNESSTTDPRSLPSDANPQVPRDRISAGKYSSMALAASSQFFDERLSTPAKMRKWKMSGYDKTNYVQDLLHDGIKHFAFHFKRREVKSLSEKEYNDFAYEMGILAGNETDCGIFEYGLQNILSNYEHSTGDYYIAEKKAATSAAGRAYISGYNEGRALAEQKRLRLDRYYAAEAAEKEAEGSFYDTAEFKGVFGNVLRGMEERGEKWEEDGIAEMDAEIEEARGSNPPKPAAEKTQAAQGRQDGDAEIDAEIEQIYQRIRSSPSQMTTDKQDAKAEKAQLKAHDDEQRQLAQQRREQADREWQELEQQAEEGEKWSAMTEKERNRVRAANAKAAKKKAAKDAAEKKAEDREAKRRNREAREEVRQRSALAKWEREEAALAKTVAEARESPEGLAYGREVQKVYAEISGERNKKISEAHARIYGVSKGMSTTLEQARADEEIIREKRAWEDFPEKRKELRRRESEMAGAIVRGRMEKTEHIGRDSELREAENRPLIAMENENGEKEALRAADGTVDGGDVTNTSAGAMEDLDKLAEEREIQELMIKERREEDRERISEEAEAGKESEELTAPLTPGQQLEAKAKAARNKFGDTLPEGLLSKAEYNVYQRLYGSPSRFTSTKEDKLADEEEPEKNLLLRQMADGSLEEVDYVLPDELDQVVDDDAELEEEDALIDEQDDAVEEELADIEDIDGVRLDDPIFTPYEGDEVALTFDEYATEQVDRPLTKEEALDKVMNEWPGDEYIRTHALTRSGRYGTNPSTLPLPRAAFIDPVQKMLAPLANKHLAEAAQKSLGGLGIPLSPNTPRIGMQMEMQPIPLTSFQTKMSDREADVYMSAVMPQTYASLTSILVEVRKRLGASWLQSLLKKEGGPLIMDAGAGGAGVIAWRELLRAEWEGMHKVNASEAVLSEDGIIPELMSEEPKTPPVPFGRSTVVTGSDPLRQRISKILENTTFIPRIPDQVDPHEHVGPQPRKMYDIILAPHTLWPIKEEYQRKGVVETLWSLLNPNGGILVIMEKGVPRGFEVVAGARDMLLKRHIASPGSESYETPLDDQKWEGVGRFTDKEKGCIIAPCTNHTACPLYKISGSARGRKDWCYFSQRYTRPPALMTVLGAKARNHDDVEYSYVAVQRGVDQRTPEGDSLHGRGFIQGASATAKALDGYGPSWSRDKEIADEEEVVDEEAIEVETAIQLENEEAPHPLSLPRTILTPLKRKGNVLIDVCTPSGTYERWLVNKRNGRQIFRDARKAKWGDLWALGARSAAERRINVGVVEDRKKEGIRKDRKAGRKGLGKRGKGRWADGDGGKMGMGSGGKKGRGRDGIKKGVIVGPGEEDD